MVNTYKHTLVLVESPAKAKIISKYLNSIPELKTKYGTFSVMATFGHIRDLKRKELSVTIEKSFEPKYAPIEEKKKVIDDLNKNIKKSDMILLASDSDLEGHAIAWHIQQHFKLKNYKRIVFNEITKPALKTAVLNAGNIDMNAVNAQQARRVLDRLVGFKLSPVLWKYYKTNAGAGGLSAGRVQSAVLKIIIDKEKDIEEFKSTSYWTIEGDFSHDITEAKLYKSGTIFKEENSSEVIKLLKKLETDFKITECATKLLKVKPDNPFITSTLQQEAYNKLGFSIKYTMKIAQELYENGHITYMRTDSFNISVDALKNIVNKIREKYGNTYLDEKNTIAKNKNNAQGAHECIRPTDINSESIKMSKDHINLYEMIWKRTISYKMKPAIYEELSVKLVDKYLKKIDDMHFLGKFKKIDFEGFLIVYGQKKDDKDLKAKISELKTAKISCKKVTAHNTWKSPPARYNESSIIKTLDNEGIGRPSTYATIISKLFDKNYATKQDVPGETKKTIHYTWNPAKKDFKENKDIVQLGKERGKIVPTNVGKGINEFLSNNFDYIIDKEFTAEMEKELDKISDGEKTYISTMNDFWQEFSKHLSKVNNVEVQQKTNLKNESMNFTYNGMDYNVKLSRYGPVVQYEDKQGDTKYKDLKNYLKLKGIGYTDVTEDDLAFITNIPYNYGNGFELRSGMYGYYIKKNGKENYKLPYKFIDKGNPEKMFKISKKDLEEITSYKKTEKTTKTPMKIKTKK
jgi:DNA topoisomerase-1